MKQIVILLFTFLLLSCTNKLFMGSYFEDKCYESLRGHLFDGNRICFQTDGKFKYIGHGPSVFVSEGIWKFEKSTNEIELISLNTNNFINRIDTMWIDLTGKRIEVKGSNKLLFENVSYKLK